MPELSESKQTYIKSIHLLTCGGMGTTSVTDLAAHMSVTKASTSYAVCELEKLGLVRRCENRRIRLTDEGIRQGELIEERYEVILRFFSQVLHVNGEASREEACKLEHMLSESSLDAMRLLLGDADLSPAARAL